MQHRSDVTRFTPKNTKCFWHDYRWRWCSDTVQWCCIRFHRKTGCFSFFLYIKTGCRFLPKIRYNIPGCLLTSFVAYMRLLICCQWERDSESKWTNKIINSINRQSDSSVLSQIHRRHFSTELQVLLEGNSKKESNLEWKNKNLNSESPLLQSPRGWSDPSIDGGRLKQGRGKWTIDDE